MLYREWSVPIWWADESTPLTDVTLTTSSQPANDAVRANGWNLDIPIPPGAKSSAMDTLCSGTYRDSHMVVINHQKTFAWDFFKARDCEGDGTWAADRVAKWDLVSDTAYGKGIGDGVDQPYTFGTSRVAPVPLLHGLITYNEVVSEGVINHALAFAGPTAKAGSPGVYPCVTPNNGAGTDPYASWLGFRFQLDPSVNCSSLGLNNYGKMVCVALQQYGMIFVENNGPGSNGIYVENLNDKPQSWKGIIGSLSALPVDKLRVIEPLTPPFNTSTTGPCSLYTSGTRVASPYGLPWNPLNAQREMLLSVTCNTNDLIIQTGNGNETGQGANLQGLTYVYDKGYYHDGSQSGAWTPYNLQCAGTDKTKIANSWCKGLAQATVPKSAKLVVGYTCIWSGVQWQCGCTDSQCSSSYWQIQGRR
jgi:hypothetical protein